MAVYEKLSQKLLPELSDYPEGCYNTAVNYTFCLPREEEKLAMLCLKEPNCSVRTVGKDYYFLVPFT